MISCYRSEKAESGGGENCTTASAFEKQKSLKFELLFGEYQNKITAKKYDDESIINAFDYTFLQMHLHTHQKIQDQNWPMTDFQ